jgi:hypothetical protein
MRSIAKALAVGSLVFCARPALADPQQCIAENEAATALRTEGKFAEAKQHYLGCAAADCPSIVRDECQALVDKMESSLSTIVFIVVDSQGKDLTGAMVFLDGAPTGEPADGRALTLNPGTHRVRAELPDGQKIEQEIIAREGEKNRSVQIQIGPVLPIQDTKPTTPAPPPEDTASHSPSPLVWALGGVAVVGLGAFTVFALDGKGKQKDLEDTCAPACPKDDVDSMYTSYLLADISLGTALVAGGVAGYLYFSSKPPTKLDVSTEQARLPIRLNVGTRDISVSYAGSF